MIFFDEKGNFRWRFTLLRLAAVFASIALIVFFMPRNNKTSFEYEVGKPWAYGSLIASYDFGIMKSKESVKKERDSILYNYEPYFNHNPELSQRMVSKFIDDHRAGIPGMPKSYIYSVASKLEQAYQRGIMEPGRYEQMVGENIRSIKVVDNKMATSSSLDSLITTKQAYESLFDSRLTPEERQALQKCNLNNYIEPNLRYDEQRTLTGRTDLLEHISLSSGVVFSGQKIIDRGEIVDLNTYRILESLREEEMRRSNDRLDSLLTLAGQVLYILLLFLVFMSYLAIFRIDYFESMQAVLMMLTLITIFPVFAALMVKHNFFNIYIIPFCITPLFVRVFMDSRTSFIVHTIMIFITAMSLRYQYEFIVVQLISGLVAIYTMRELTSRSQIIRSALLVTATSMLIYFCFELMNDDTLSKLNETMYIYFAVNGIALLFTYPLMYFVERIFGYTSDITLVELSNANNTLLRRMSEIAPGTFQHSIQVSNLAAAVASRIGAKSQLVRTGALYHDIGKMENPAFFTENHSSVDPHANLSLTESAEIIINHVREGERLAEKYDLPSIIRDFISTHHGAGMAKYFYISYKNAHPDEDVDTAPFSYPGPNPFTREQACLMMADTVEAASRSLKEYDEDSISQLVTRLVDQQVADGFYKECPITYRDIAVAKQVLTEKLKMMYHTRITYPELKKKKNKRRFR